METGTLGQAELPRHRLRVISTAIKCSSCKILSKFQKPILLKYKKIFAV
ncbi:hypothetical protein DYY67_1267 [Candidatus Nitrosotalea sp. TS]|nr:hypothetical protein [Candidatus Nitrosotalea sp. TS]